MFSPNEAERWYLLHQLVFGKSKLSTRQPLNGLPRTYISSGLGLSLDDHCRRLVSANTQITKAASAAAFSVTQSPADGGGGKNGKIEDR